MKKYSKFLIVSVLSLCFVSCGKGIKIAKEEPVRKIISYSIYLKPTEKGHKSLMMYCNSEGTSINYENLTFVRYGNEEELRNNWYNGVVDTIQVVFNAVSGNIKHNDKLCITYLYYEKNEKNRGWYTLIVCDSVPTSLTYERNDKKVKYDVVSYTICKNAPLWNDTYPDMMYYPETDEYYKAKDDESENYINDGFDDISKIPPSIIQYVPNGYSIVDIVFGDLNDDKIDDAAVILENTDTYNTKLQILFGKGNNTFLFHELRVARKATNIIK
jgi:ribosomal protein S6